MPKSLTILLTVSSIPARDKLIKQLYTNITKEPSTVFTVLKDQVNRIRIYHNAQFTKVLIRTYLVIVLPVLIDLNPLRQISGHVDFHLEETIQELETLTTKLRSLQGRRFVKENQSGKTLQQLVECLCEAPRENRAG